MNNIEDLSEQKIYHGKIVDVTRQMINLIVITVEIGSKTFVNKLWGHCISTRNYTEDQFEHYLEVEDQYMLNKFYRRFQIDFEDRDILIGRDCYCRKNIYKNRPYLKIMRIV